jgi:hypothetical protein
MLRMGSQKHWKIGYEDWQSSDAWKMLNYHVYGFPHARSQTTHQNHRSALVCLPLILLKRTA